MSDSKHPLLKVENLKMYFPVEQTWLGKPTKFLKAVDGLNFSIEEGTTFGLVGESGCGKTTAGKCVLRIYTPTDGTILYRGEDITHLTDAQLKPYRRDIQLIFQDPYGSLDPRQSVGSIIKEAVMADGKSRSSAEVRDRVEELLTLVELNPVMADRFPHEMSGGQRQRLGIARALACEPKLIVCDEPVSALDVSIQAQIINLFEALQEKLGLTYLFIAHDLAVVRHIADYIAVMSGTYCGEHGGGGDLFPSDASLHEGAVVGGADYGLLCRAEPDQNCAGRRGPQSDSRAGGMPVPSTLPLRHRYLPEAGSGAEGRGRGTLRGLS